MNVSPVAMIVALLAIAATAGMFHRRAPKLVAIAASLASAACFVAFVLAAPAMARGETPADLVRWIPSLGIEAAFRVDGLSLVFALLITGIGAIVLAYTPPYMHGDPRTGRLIALLLAFEAAMIGLVTADDTMTLFVFWELTSFASFFLISLDSTQELARTRARQALVITAGGGLVLLVGLLLLAAAAEPGATGVSALLSQLGDAPIREHAHYAPIVILIALGAFTKSAQVPFHFWLPGAMVAPSPVSAYLHSATMVKAGIYLLARMHPTLGGTSLWVGLLVAVGTTTFVVGAVLATVQRDVKLSLAYATVSALGALTMLLGIGTTYAIGGAIVLLLAHGCYKAALFLTAGNLDHHRGTRDPFAAPSGTRDMPVTAAVALVSAVSMAGIPPLLGFIAKDAILAATVQGPAAIVVTAAAVLAGAGLVCAAWLTGVVPYLRGGGAWSRRDVAPSLLVGPVVLALASLAFGLLPSLVASPLVLAAAHAVAGTPVAYEVALWPGLAGAHGLAFGLGLVSILIGAVAALLVTRHRDAVAAARERSSAWTGATAHEAMLAGLGRLASGLTRHVQTGSLPLYVATLAVTVVIVAGAALLGSDLHLTPTLGASGTYEIPLLLVAALSVLAAAVFRDRLSSIAALAATGLAVTFLFALFSGPDLAITQLTVETMMVILLVLVFRRLPPSSKRDRHGRRLTRALIAGACGVVVTALLLVATSTSGFETTASAGQAHEAPGQGFTNVVNAILVNFRALDTLGEITVLAIAGIGVIALAARQPRRT